MSRDHSESDLDLTGLPALPSGWRWVTLSSFARIDGGITKDQKRQRTAAMREVPYLRVANVQRGFLDLQEIKTILADTSEVEGLRLHKGDILFTEGGDRDKLGRGWVWNEEIEDCIHQNHIFRARPILSIAEPKFVSYHGNFFGQQWFTRTGKQTTNLASINKGVLSRFPVPLAPLNEQRRIVAKIEELFSDLDAGVAALNRAKANLKRYRAAVLKAAVEGKLTEDWRAKHPKTEPASKLLERILTERRKKWEADQLAKFAAAGKEPPKNWEAKYVEPTPPDMSDLPDLPPGWCWAGVGQLYEVKYGLSEPLKNTEAKSPIDLPIISIRNVNSDGQLALDELKYFPIPIPKRSSLLLRKGDLLFNWRNAPNLIGKTAIFNLEGDYVNASFLLRMRPPKADLDGRFTWLYANFLRLSGYFKMESNAAVNQSNFNASRTSGVVVPLPSLDEQRQIVESVMLQLSDIDRVQRCIEADLLRAARLRQSILKQAFEGKLVPQNPKDEPASGLLERIKAEPKTTSGNGKPTAAIRKRIKKETT